MDFQEQYNAYFCRGISLLKEEIAHIEVYDDVGVVVYEDRWGQRRGLFTENVDIQLDWFYAEPADIPF